MAVKGSLRSGRDVFMLWFLIIAMERLIGTRALASTRAHFGD